MSVLSGLQEMISNVSFGKLILDTLRFKNSNDVALIDAHTNASVTYGEILEQSIIMAYNFQQIGISKNDVIAIVRENDLNYVIPVFAALYIGAIVQPANPEWNYRELNHIFEISKPKWVICSETASKVVDQLRNKIESIHSVFEFGKESYTKLLHPINVNLLKFQTKLVEPSEQVAFVFSSSGTTSLPKGVMITHQGMVQTVKYWTHCKYGNYQKGDVTVVPMPLFHLFGMNMILISIIAGAKYVIMTKFNAELYLHCIERYQANKISGPPSLICFLAKSSLINKYDLSSVEDVISGSAPLKSETEKNFKSRFNATLRQTYATTETSGACTIVPSNSTQPGSCGVLLPNIKARVRDVDTKEILGVNQIGELCFKGPILMKGYMNNLQVTREAFDDNGFYLTGDIGYFNDEGYFYIVDRLKDMIKYKGYQIAPAELESVLLSHPSVADAAVIGVPNEKAGEVPLAYVVKQKQGVTKEELLDFVQENVSVEKRLYGGLIFINEIPRNAAGKILKGLLKKNEC